jgi:hypothetical protein
VKDSGASNTSAVPIRSLISQWSESNSPKRAVGLSASFPWTAAIPKLYISYDCTDSVRPPQHAAGAAKTPSTARTVGDTPGACLRGVLPPRGVGRGRGSGGGIAVPVKDCLTCKPAKLQVPQSNTLASLSTDAKLDHIIALLMQSPGAVTQPVAKPPAPAAADPPSLVNPFEEVSADKPLLSHSAVETVTRVDPAKPQFPPAPIWLANSGKAALW